MEDLAESFTEPEPDRPFCREALPHLIELRRAARRFAGTRRDVADDLVQETFLRALAAADRYRPGSNARAWLYAILTNTARSTFRRERRDAMLRERYAIEPSVPVETTAAPSLPPGGFRISSAASSRVGRRPPSSKAQLSLRELVAELPPEFRAVVELVDLQGLSYKDVAARLGCPVGTVMSRLHRARRRLRDRLDASGRDAVSDAA